MIERAIIHVSGPGQSGKTAFIEALIRAFDEGDVACVRATAGIADGEPEESSPEGHPELKRWRQAGAAAVALFHFDPGDETVADGFFATDVMATYSKVMVIEGDSPLEGADLEVFVARLPGAGGSVLCRAVRDVAAERRALVESMEKTFRTTDLLFGGTGKHLLDPALVEQLREHFVNAPADGDAATSDAPGEKWQVAAGYEGIEKAGLVFGNVFAPGEQPLVAPFLDEVARLRRDKAVFDDVIAWRGDRVAITAVAGNMMDAKDPGLRKAVARVRRVVRGIG